MRCQPALRVRLVTRCGCSKILVLESWREYVLLPLRPKDVPFHKMKFEGNAQLAFETRVFEYVGQANGLPLFREKA